MIRRIDPYTLEIFYAKRKNQYFANRKNQIAYNNEKAKQTRDLMAEIDNHVRKNWQILVDILKDRESAFKTKDYLLGCGYNFNFFNNQKFINGELYCGIYDYGINLVDSGLYKIIKLEEDE
jgi:hypothetical protein